MTVNTLACYYTVDLLTDGTLETIHRTEHDQV